MGQFTSNITAEPVGFIVYIQQASKNLSTAELCNETALEIIEVMNMLTAASGFNPEPDDAIGFFLFENNAQSFAETLLGKIN